MDVNEELEKLDAKGQRARDEFARINKETTADEELTSEAKAARIDEARRKQNKTLGELRKQTEALRAGELEALEKAAFRKPYNMESAEYNAALRLVAGSSVEALNGYRRRAELTGDRALLLATGFEAYVSGHSRLAEQILGDSEPFQALMNHKRGQHTPAAKAQRVAERLFRHAGLSG